MNRQNSFFVLFFFTAFLTKIAGEFVHELMGHGIFILLFGGEIVKVHISLLWPYDFSSIWWSGNFETWQMALTTAGGIIVSLLVSFLFQALLLLRRIKDWRLLTVSFWFSFWTFLNPTGYLVVGGIRPLGDVAALISQGALTQTTSLLMGVMIFAIAFFSISKILADLLINTAAIRKAKSLHSALGLFWLTIPIATLLMCIGTRQPLYDLAVFTVISCLPSLIAFVTFPMLTKELNSRTVTTASTCSDSKSISLKIR
jgi:hypothetical protein